MDGQTDRWMEGWIDKQKDGRMDRQIDGQKDGQMTLFVDFLLFRTFSIFWVITYLTNGMKNNAVFIVMITLFNYQIRPQNGRLYKLDCSQNNLLHFCQKCYKNCIKWNIQKIRSDYGFITKYVHVNYSSLFLHPSIYLWLHKLTSSMYIVYYITCLFCRLLFMSQKSVNGLLR